MAVSLPNAADAHKAREQAAKSSAERAEVARTPLLAMLGAGEAAVTAMTKVFAETTKAMTDAMTRATQARGRAGEQAEQVQHRLAELPQRMSGEELRKFLDEMRVQVEKFYAEFAERGEHTWEQWRSQPQFQQAVANLKAYSEKLDAHVDTFVEEARDAGEKALGTVSRQTRSAGERVARSTQSQRRRRPHVTRSARRPRRSWPTPAPRWPAHRRPVTRRPETGSTAQAANRAAPRTAADRAAVRKPATRRTSPTAEPTPES